MSAPQPVEHEPAVTGDLTTAELGRWVDRGVAIMCVSALFPTMAVAHIQLTDMHLGWLLMVAGAIVASSVLMPFYAWSDRGMRLPAVLFASAVLVGLLSWPAAWLGQPTHSGHVPWLWISLIVATAATAIVLGYRVGLVYLALCAASYFYVRTTPSGGDVGWLIAAQDTLLAVAQPAALLASLHYARRAVADLDASRARTHTERAEAAVKEALVAERARLDAIVHDEVMTTLVAAARSTGRHERPVVDQARTALGSLADAESEAGISAPLTPEQFEWLLADVVASVAPTATFTATTSPTLGVLPQDAVSALARATREACLNASRHAHASSIRVELTGRLQGGCPRVSVAVSDDGVGFDPAAVASERLGIRLSLRERMRVVGGTVDLQSAPGRGTRVDLEWSGGPAKPLAARPARRVDFWEHPIFAEQAVAPYAYSVGALMTVYTLIGWLWLNRYSQPELAATALVAVGIATAVGLSRLGARMSLARVLLIAGLALATTVLTLLALPAGPWASHALWFPGAVALLLVIVRAGDQPQVAWISACLYGIAVLLAAAVTDEEFVAALGTALTPLMWVGVLEFFIDWLARVHGQLVDSEVSAEQSATANATAFSKLVLREVWLADLRGHVGALLEKLADETVPLTDDDRELCLVTEGTLRDNIKAHNLTSPSVAEVIVAARRRGVQVTLVDNRGSTLPDHVRRATLRHLEAVVRTMSSGRLVARTAPEGYDEAVTIVAADMDGAPTMTTIDNDGKIVVRT